MACSLALSGLAHDCDSNMGGVKAIWIAPYTVDAATVSEDIITEISNSNEYKYYGFRKGAASLTKTANIDSTNGIAYVSSELLINFSKMDTTKRIEMNALLLSDVSVIVKDNNGKYWFLGYSEPVTASAGGGQTGQAKTDANQYSITLTDECAVFPYEVSKTVGDALPKDWTGS